MAVETRTVAVVVDTSRSRHARLRPLPLNAVTLDDDFWAPRRRINSERTLPSQYRRLEDAGVLDNFRRAAGTTDVPFQGMWFTDSDLYKWLEAAAWTLAADAGADLEELVDAAIAEIAGAQQPDGYLNTYYTFDRSDQRWTNLLVMHEMYCAGHLIQAAVAHHRVTGSVRLLDVARRLADHICDMFGPAEEGKRPGTDGHEEIEMALVEIFRDTGDPKYLRQAQYFVDVRGRGLAGGREYSQDHKPFREQDEIVGHAVRAVYLNAGVADLCAETGEASLYGALVRLWDSMTTGRMYVSGGIGSRYEGEAFGKDYVLPNERAYTETCAAIGSVMWSWRMLMLDADARYADLMETTLYNGILPGLSLDGQSYFYQNPLADDGTHRRSEWFSCACCPPNIARLLASLPGYFYSVSDEAVWVHLYAEGSARVALPDGRVVQLHQRTRYPWDGDILLEVQGGDAFTLLLRIPAWCERGATLEVNGEPLATGLNPGSYAEVRREWRPGDTVRLNLPMPVRRVECHPYVEENAGRVALMRGPLLYCVEGADNLGADLRDLLLPSSGDLREEFRPDHLGGVVALHSEARVEPPGAAWSHKLYCTTHPGVGQPGAETVEVTAIPYYAWANREPGTMRVWLRTYR